MRGHQMRHFAPTFLAERRGELGTLNLYVIPDCSLLIAEPDCAQVVVHAQQSRGTTDPNLRRNSGPQVVPQVKNPPPLCAVPSAAPCDGPRGRSRGSRARGTQASHRRRPQPPSQDPPSQDQDYRHLHDCRHLHSESRMCSFQYNLSVHQFPARLT